MIREKSVATIYLVEDNAGLRMVMRELLGNDQHIAVVGVASSADTALTEIIELQPDLVITDLSLPRMSGLELTEKLAGQDVIVYSIHEGTNYVQQAKVAGARGYVSKSAGLHALREAVAHVLESATYGFSDNSEPGREMRPSSEDI